MKLKSSNTNKTNSTDSIKTYSKISAEEIYSQEYKAKRKNHPDINKIFPPYCQNISNFSKKKIAGKS